MKVKGDVKKITVTQRQLASAFGVTPARVNHLIKDEIVVRDEDNPGGAVLLYESVKRYWSGQKNEEVSIEAELDLTRERAKHEKTKREIAELRLAKMENRAYDAKTVELVLTEMLSNLRTQLLGMPSKLAPQLEGKPRGQIYELMTRELEERLSELSEYSPELFTEEEIEAYRKGLPELPDARRERYMKEFGLSAYDAGIITASRAMAEYFEACLAGGADAKSAANWIMGDLAKNLNAEGKTIEESPVEASRLAQMLALIEKGTISSKIAKKVFAEMWTSSDAPEKIVEDKGLVQITDTKAIEAIVDAVIAANPKPVADYKSGNKKALGALVGQVMKQSKGKANPQMVNQLLADKLS